MIKTFFAVAAVLTLLWTPQSKAEDSPSVAGKWHFVLNTAGGDRELTSIFEQSAERVSGRWGVEEKKEGAPVAGTFAERKLALEFTVDSDEIGPGPMKISGLLADDGTLSGDWSFKDYSGTFKASRAKAEPPK